MIGEDNKMSVNRKDIVMKNVNDLVPDPNQPRTIFNDEDIENTANTMLRQGVINPIEIDEHNMIVTGEVRWRAAKFAKIEMVPCTVWKNGNHKRFERQAIENLNQHHLEESDRNATIVKLWETKNEKGEPMYPSMEALAKAVGLSRQVIGQILLNKEFTQRTQMTTVVVSSKNISETADLDDHIRVKILEKVSEGKIRPSDVSEIAKIAKVSDELLDKVLEKEIPVQRATQAAETIKNIEKDGVKLSEAQKQNLANKVAEDETILDKYKSAVLAKVRQVATTVHQPRITEPIGRTSPVQHMIKTKDEVMDRYRVYLGNCDANERLWAKRIMVETRDELSLLIEMIQDD